MDGSIYPWDEWLSPYYFEDCECWDWSFTLDNLLVRFSSAAACQWGVIQEAHVRPQYHCMGKERDCYSLHDEHQNTQDIVANFSDTFSFVFWHQPHGIWIPLSICIISYHVLIYTSKTNGYKPQHDAPNATSINRTRSISSLMKQIQTLVLHSACIYNCTHR